MPSIVDKLNNVRGTRPAQAISAAMFLAVGLYNLFYKLGSVRSCSVFCFLLWEHS